MGKGSGDSCRQALTLEAAAADAPVQPAGSERMYQEVLDGVRAMGFPAAASVGGCERDRELGRAIKDVDVFVAGVTPDELLALCKQHGKASPLEVDGKLIGVRLTAPWTPKEGIEIALARTEVSTGLGFHDFKIVPIEPPAELLALPIDQRGPAAGQWLRDAMLRDLERRDFTCNAIARDVYTGEMLDPFNGVADLRAGIIRAVSDDTFRDDPLRSFRLLARMGKDGLVPDEHTDALLREAAPKLRPLDRDRLTADDVQVLRERIAAHVDLGVIDRELSDAEVVELADALRDPERYEGPLGRLGMEPVDLYKTPLSAERIQAEVEKTLSGVNGGPALRYGRDVGLLQVALPELNDAIGFDQQSKYHNLTCDEHILEVVSHACKLGASREVRWAALLHDAGKPASAFEGKDGRLHFYAKKPGQRFARPATEQMIDFQRAAVAQLGKQADRSQVKQRAEQLREQFRRGELDAADLPGRAHEVIGADIAEQALRRLRCDADTVKKVKLLVSEHMYRDDDGFERRSEADRAKRARRFIARVGRENVEDLLMLRRCDRSGKGYDVTDQPGWDAEISLFEQVVRQQMHQPLTVRELAVNGNDLQKLGLKGPALGATLKELLHRVVLEPEHNQRERLLDWARGIAAKAA